MPIDIAALQRRMAEQGRIRLGQKGPKGQPVTARPVPVHVPERATDRATSRPSTAATAHPWDNGGLNEYEVVSERNEIPVIVVKGGVSQWFEPGPAAGASTAATGSSAT